MASPATFDAFKGKLDTWAETPGNLPVVYENDPFQGYVEASLPFVYVEIYGDSYDQTTVGSPGSNMWTERGTTWMHVMVKSLTGTSQARAYAKQLLDLFREVSVIADDTTGEQLFMPEMSIGSGEPGKDFPEYFSMAATIQWYRRDYNA